MDNETPWKRDHSTFPEVVTSDGEVLSEADVAFAYSREGRRTIGKEYPNPVPLEPPIGYIQQEPLHVQIRRMVLSERMAQEADAAGFDTPEEADDFDVDDDYDPSSPWEEVFEPQQPWPARAEVQQAEVSATANSQSSSAPDPGVGGGEAPQPASK